MAPSVDPKAVLSSLVAGYIKLPLAQKVLFPLLVIFSVGAIVYVSKLATQPDYTVLYSDLSSGDAAAVVERLKEMRASYRVDGGTISVSPPESVHELRLSLASDGIPKTGSVGFELFDGTNFATTTLGEMVKKQRAIQGELERTIMSIDSVVSARVHISQPEKTVFAKSAQDPSASVLLKLRPGAELDKKQISGITNFVANSVEGLKPQNVTIIDMYGNLLTSKEAEGGDEHLGADAGRLLYIREVEKGYAQRIEVLLAKVLGPNRVVARVNADIDFSSSEREEESYDPAGQVVRSERTVEEGAAAQPRGGIPGTVSNLTNGPLLVNPPVGSEQNNRLEKVKNFEVSRAITRSAQARGKVVRLSAGVLIDGKYTEIAELGGDGKPTGKMMKEYLPLSPEMMSQVEGIVKSAIGYDSSRGDLVTVENVPFYEPDESLAAELAKADESAQWYRLASMAVPVLALLLFVFVVLRPMVKFLTSTNEPEVDLGRLLPADVAELEAKTRLATAESPEGAGVAAISADTAEGAATPGAAKRSPLDLESSVDLEQLGEIMAENSRLVKENPQQAALLIRYWLNDGRL